MNDYPSIGYTSEEDIQQKVINMYLTDGVFTRRQIAREVKIDPSKVTEYIVNAGIITKRKCVGVPYRKRSLNQNIFSIIDSADKAYWLGFLSADGHIREGVTLTVNLQYSDFNHLEKLLIFLESDANITYRKATNSWHVDVNSKKLTNDLYTLGFRHDKSKNQSLSKIDYCYHSHFIRGLMDGDGSLKRGSRYRKSSNNKMYSSSVYSVRFHGTHEIVTRISEIISKNINLPIRKIHK